MATITISGGITFDNSMVTGLTYSRAIGAADTLSFTLHVPVISGQNKIKPYKTFVTMTADHESFSGRVINIDTTQQDNGTLVITCEGSMAYLHDSFVFPGSPAPTGEEPEPEPEPEENNNENSEESNEPTRDVTVVVPGEGGNTNVTTTFDLGTPKAGTTLNTLMSAVIHAHNAFISDPRLRMQDYITNSGHLKLVHDLTLEGLSLWDAMNKIAEDMGLEWYVNGTHIMVDKKFGSYKGDLKTGVNLNSVSKTEDAGDIYTAILPLGGVGYDEKRLSLTSQPCNEYSAGAVLLGSIYNYTDFNIGSRSRPIVKNEELCNLYGARVQLKIYDNIVVNAPEEYHNKRDELLTQAQSDCEQLSKQTISINASAFDFANSPIGGPGPELSVYNYYKVDDYITGINTTLRLTKKEINYDDILNPSLTFALDDRKDTAEKAFKTPHTTVITNNGN